MRFCTYITGRNVHAQHLCVDYLKSTRAFVHSFTHTAYSAHDLANLITFKSNPFQCNIQFNPIQYNTQPSSILFEHTVSCVIDVFARISLSSANQFSSFFFTCGTWHSCASHTTTQSGSFRNFTIYRIRSPHINLVFILKSLRLLMRLFAAISCDSQKLNSHRATQITQLLCPFAHYLFIRQKKEIFSKITALPSPNILSIFNNFGILVFNFYKYLFVLLVALLNRMKNSKEKGSADKSYQAKLGH